MGLNKVETIGIALSIAAMAVALWLLRVETANETLAINQNDQTGAVFIAEDENQRAAVGNALLDASNAIGQLERLIIDDVVVGSGDAVESGDTVTVDYIGTLQNWNKPTITDSGGFQVFSLGAAFGKGVTKFAKGESTEENAGLNVYSKELATQHGKLCVIDEEGVTFTSHIDGSMHRFTAERSIEIQHNIGADIIIAFDECTSPTAEREYQIEAMDRTHRWAKRSILAHKQNYEALKKQGLYGVVQGGRHLDLRQESARVLSEMEFDGFGIGGSFSKEDLGESLRVVNEILPVEKPRHLLGIGEPEDIIDGVLNGCDTFDCVAPTRLGRTGTIYAETGKVNDFGLPVYEKLNLINAKFTRDFSPLDVSDSPMNVYTKAYLQHLFKSKEMLGPHIASVHNLWTIVNFTKRLRERLLSS
jgi:queuine tRNA-ribosyltransferase